MPIHPSPGGHFLVAPALLRPSAASLPEVGIVDDRAFASVAPALARELDAPLDIVDPNGGAVALGHPLGGIGPS